MMIRALNGQLCSMKRFEEDLRISRHEELSLKYSLKEKVVQEKNSKYKTYLKERSMKAQRRHSDAAAKRKALDEEKKMKILARRSRSESKDAKSDNSSELRASSRPGVFINLSKNNLRGTAGFGKGFERRPESYISCKQGVNFVDTSVCDRRPRERQLDLPCHRNCRSLNMSETTISSELSDMKTSGSTGSQIDSETVDIRGDESFSSRDTPVNVPQAQETRSFINDRVYRSIRRKRVSFNASKNDQNFSKPVIKKSLVIETPETKRGILMKMSALSSRLRNSGRVKYEPGMLLRVTLPNKNKDEIDLKGRGDDSPVSSTSTKECHLVTEATNTDPTSHNYPINSITTSFLMEDVSDQSGCRKLLQSCETEKINRKLKLARLHEDLIKIEKETKRLNDKNAEVKKKYFIKSQNSRGKLGEKLNIKSSSADIKNKIINIVAQAATTPARPRMDKQYNLYLTDGMYKRYTPCDESYKSCNSLISQTSRSTATEIVTL